MNKHLKGGIIVGIAAAILLSGLGLIAMNNRDNPFWEAVSCFVGILVSPVISVWESLGFTGCKGLGVVFWIIGSFLLYFFTIGFCIGVSISYLTGQVVHKRKNQSPQGLNNGSPG